MKLFIKLTLAVTAILFVTSGPRANAEALCSVNDLAGCSFKELSQTVLSDNLQKLSGEMKKFTETSLPPEAKPLRRDIGQLKNYVSLFLHAYPQSSEPAFEELFDLLDDAYMYFGNFKDLYDTQLAANPDLAESDVKYDAAELKEKRRVALIWKQNFLVAAQRNLKLFEQVASSNQDVIFDAKGKFYWNYVDYRPKLNTNGFETLIGLTKDLLAETAKETKEVLKIKDVTDEDQEEEFHDYRKRIRAILKFTSYFPGLISDVAESSEHFEALDSVVDNFGGLNDLIQGYHRAEESGNNSKAKRISKKIKKEWKDLREWLEKIDVNDQLSEFASML